MFSVLNTNTNIKYLPWCRITMKMWHFLNNCATKRPECCFFIFWRYLQAQTFYFGQLWFRPYWNEERKAGELKSAEPFVKTCKMGTEFTKLNIQKPADTGYGSGYESDLTVGIEGCQCATFDAKTYLVIGETWELHAIRCLQRKSVLTDFKTLRQPAIPPFMTQLLLIFCFAST